MLRAIDRAWRLLGTGLGFALIFGGGAVGALTVLPLIVASRRLRTGDPAAGSRQAQYAIHRFFRVYLALIQALGTIRIEIDGADKFSRLRGSLVVANHPTILDVVVLMASIPRTQCIVKHQLWHSRYLGGLVRICGYIPNDLDSATLLEACRKSLAMGDNLIIFPEGTRTRPGEPPRFQRGFANIALLTKAPIQLVTITCEPLTMTKGEPWWRVPTRRPVFRVTVDEYLTTDDLLQHAERPKAARALVRQVEAHYGERLAIG